MTKQNINPTHFKITNRKTSKLHFNDLAEATLAREWGIPQTYIYLFQESIMAYGN